MVKTMTRAEILDAVRDLNAGDAITIFKQCARFADYDTHIRRR